MSVKDDSDENAAVFNEYTDTDVLSDFLPAWSNQKSSKNKQENHKNLQTKTSQDTTGYITSCPKGRHAMSFVTSRSAQLWRHAM